MNHVYVICIYQTTLLRYIAYHRLVHKHPYYTDQCNDPRTKRHRSQVKLQQRAGASTNRTVHIALITARKEPATNCTGDYHMLASHNDQREQYKRYDIRVTCDIHGRVFLEVVRIVWRLYAGALDQHCRIHKCGSEQGIEDESLKHNIREKNII